MDDGQAIELRKTCCTCLSRDRKLYQLCRLTNGVNDLYLLLSFDSEAYREGFYKDAANLFICWECRAVMRRISMFREQACAVQKQLSYIQDGRTDVKYIYVSHSRLAISNTITCSTTLVPETSEELTDNFIDCGPLVDAIKSEDDEDLPLSELHTGALPPDSPCIPIDNFDEEKPHFENLEPKIEQKEKPKIEQKEKPKKRIRKPKKKYISEEEQKKYFTTTVMSQQEMCESRERRKMLPSYADASHKCESCLEGFKNVIDWQNHNLCAHTESPHYFTQCDICLAYIRQSSEQAHVASHYHRLECQLCGFISYTLEDMLAHLKSTHAIQNLAVRVERKRSENKTPVIKKPGSKPRMNVALRDKPTPLGYRCPECSKCFENKKNRWTHIQQAHREGFKCGTCGKAFAFRNVLARHELRHVTPMVRSECPTCHKMIKRELMKVHQRIHLERETFTCVECDKRFISQASYEHHLKYTRAHAAIDILKFKCTMCDKGYRSRGELRDHVNYQHMGKTQHKCPICDKALASPRCITRHVKRAHSGVKENAKDKICQQCGKAFRDKKNLREHELIHTGERPLSCEVCGCTFRQHASLYTHKKRVHKIYPPKKHVELVTDAGKSCDGTAPS